MTDKQEKDRKKSGKNQKVRKKTKSSNIFQIVRCILFIIVSYTSVILVPVCDPVKLFCQY